ncbi:hypothetical protein FNF27_07817 [Cafeteria roenbergensis]|nr:hypothetical protein FNF28_04504 [Cafeteria roenbergensis]KAA0164324.1 hypothetical protein FNF27_07817 [Cafeteria roenbergensis]KAA0166742.1 hypothetical protein FNF31_01117 [Cafeteria roenbergensis]
MAAAAASTARKVCVTGASGFIASHLTAMLLERGYTVHGTVRSMARKDKTEHLLALPGAADRLKLFEADLLKPESFDAAVAGCQGVFHTASPFFMAKPEDPEKELLTPAREGTIAVLEAAKRVGGVSCFVVTSSMAAVMIKEAPEGHVWSEKDWSDADSLRARERWYPLSKTIAERAAWDWHEANGKPFRMAAINPTLVSGPMLQPTLNESSAILAAFVTGKRDEIPTGCMSWVDVRDTALAHILAMEQESAAGTKEEALTTGKGRYTAVGESAPWRDVALALKAGLPADLAARVPTPSDEVSEKPTDYNTSATKALGLKWRTTTEMVTDLARCEPFIAAIRAELAKAETA